MFYFLLAFYGIFLLFCPSRLQGGSCYCWCFLRTDVDFFSSALLSRNICLYLLYSWPFNHLLQYHVSLCLPLTHISCQLINRKAWFRTLSNGLYFIFFMIALCRGCLSMWCMTCSCMVRSLQWNKPRSEVITLSGSVCDRPPFLFFSYPSSFSLKLYLCWS